MSNTNEKSLNLQSNPKVPLCPYKHVECIKYNLFLEYGVCQTHTNRHHKSIRCCWLPSWVPNGWHLAKMRGGRLHV
jgi:hypothetical protein